MGPAADIPIPNDVETVDVSGLTLVPGFIDAHVHMGFAAPSDVVAGGVTTVRDLGWIPAEIYPLAARSKAASFEGPQILAAGPILTAVGGYPTRATWAPAGSGLEVTDERAARETVTRLVSDGACVIKVALDPRVGPTLALDVLTAIVDRAHELGSKVTGHVSGLAELEKALDAGLDELAHMLMSDEKIPSATIERMVASGMALVPTLSCRFGHDLATAIDNVARFRDAGGRVIYGTDLGNEGPRPGIDEREVAAMAKAGFSARDIIRSATVESASWLGLEDRGVLASGKLADITALPADGKRIEDLHRVERVWRRGISRVG